MTVYGAGIGYMEFVYGIRVHGLVKLVSAESRLR